MFRLEKYNFLRKNNDFCWLNSAFPYILSVILYLWIRIHGPKWIRIRSDPDPHHWILQSINLYLFICRDHPAVLKQAISAGRRLQDPLVEFSQLCNPENDILCLRYHPTQVIDLSIYLSIILNILDTSIRGEVLGLKNENG